MRKRQVQIYGYAAIAVVGAVALMWWPLLLGRPPVHPANAPVIINGPRLLAITATSALGIAWVVFFGLRIWRKQDEFVQQGGKFAWYWGGTIGLLSTVPIYIFIGRGGLHWLWPQIPASRELSRAFVMGYGLALFGLGVGVMTARVFWRLRNR